MRFKVEGSARFREAAKQLREAGRVDLRREMVSRMRVVGKEIVADQRAEVRNLRVTSPPFYRGGFRPEWTPTGMRKLPVRRRPNTRSTGLRDRVARTLTVEIKTTGNPRVRFISKGDKMPAGQQNMPRNMDKPKGWRHPVFGNWEMWVAQTGGPWFWPPIKRKIRVFRERIDEAITATVEKIERG